MLVNEISLIEVLVYVMCWGHLWQCTFGLQWHLLKLFFLVGKVIFNVRSIYFNTDNERINAYCLKSQDEISSGPPDFEGLNEFRQFQTSSSYTMK